LIYFNQKHTETEFASPKLW